MTLPPPGESWWQRGAIYQIYPRSFADSDGDGVGDLRGIRDRLDHLQDGTPGSLGVEAIWLSPFYVSPMADFGYDVEDYRNVDPLFGTLADFDALVEECHRRGIRVVVDLVLNHTSDRHPWFAASRSSRDDPRRDWYVWRDGPAPGVPPNDWGSCFGAVGRAWTYDAPTGQWYLHSYLPEQPDLNWDNPEVEAAVHDVMRFWLDRGVDGFRLDAVHRIAKAPDLRSSADGAPAPDEDWHPTIHERMRRLRAVVDAYEDRMLVGEVYLFDLERLLAYVGTGDELHLAHNFVFLRLAWDAAAFRTTIDAFERLATPQTWPAWFLANHDHARVASRWDDDGRGAARARAVLLMLYALKGTPFVYQGEELGLPDADIPADRVVDVDGRDPERAPVPWRPPSEVGPGAGFTTGEPWLPITAAAEELCVARQTADPRSTLALTRRLAWLRREDPLLRTGGQETVDAGADVLAWVRTGADGGRLLALVNFAAADRRLRLPHGLPLHGRLELSTDPDRLDGADVAIDGLVLGPIEAVLVRL